MAAYVLGFVVGGYFLWSIWWIFRAWFVQRRKDNREQAALNDILDDIMNGKYD